ncbi:nuclease-related domain-containing protein [Clostridium sp. AM58-1XD]|uniref:nuclease-related domain-containing protein n=1 Tax=Clostridium sp. AM58-1XD TaxID=2292307 RepID=UPI000E4D9845|nr:nuclease-related domain-containing protein [Clostridium sp. AM58-1XD]RGY98262.1 NERD domain-containing protein [Clostridium sp. AM58-1XD]
MPVYIIFFLLFVTAVLLAKKTYRFRRYRRSEYRMETGKRRKKIENDKGTAGEYETSLVLEKIKGKKRFVFNAYIPKADGKGYVETDIIMIHENGIFVIENKNYSGTIIGRADREFWCQILPGRKRSFYSPVYQNQNHIRHLKSYLIRERNGLPEIPIVSAIVFNDGVKLRRIWRMGTSDVIVSLSSRAAGKIRRRIKHMDCVLDEREVEDIYRLLKDRSEVFRWVKKKHAKKVKKYMKKA